MALSAGSWHEERLLIDGELVPADGGATYDNVNPATEEVIGVSADASPQFDKGFFFQPTLLADVTNDMEIAREEVFGPVLVVIPYEEDDDAVRIANDSIYGLSGGVSGVDRDRVLSVARRVRTGTLSINGGLWYAPDVPFGGFKQSGLGREMGIAGFEEYLELRAMAEPA